MSSYKLIIPFTPQAKASVRVSKNCHYNPSARGMLKTRCFVEKVMQENKWQMLKGPLLVIAHFRIPAPLTLSERKRQQQNCRPHMKRPDGDNLEKFLNDALNGVLWEDDSRICWMVRTKSLTQSKEGSTVLFATELPQDTPHCTEIMRYIADNMDLTKEFT